MWRKPQKVVGEVALAHQLSEIASILRKTPKLCLVLHLLNC